MIEPNDSDKPNTPQPAQVVHLPRPRPSLVNWISTQVVAIMIEVRETQELEKAAQAGAGEGRAMTDRN